MTEEQINLAIKYIRTHMPLETELETIDVAISSVTGGIHAATKKDLVNPDDAWLIPDEEKDQFAGIKGNGWAQSFDKTTIQAFKDAVIYAKTQNIQKKVDNQINDIDELKSLKNELLNVNNFIDKDIDNNNNKLL